MSTLAFQAGLPLLVQKAKENSVAVACQSLIPIIPLFGPKWDSS